MNNFNGLQKDMPSTVGEFSIEIQGDLTGKQYGGDYKCKILNRKDRAMISKHRAFLNGPLEDQLDIDTLQYHHKIAYLRFSLTTSHQHN